MDKESAERFLKENPVFLIGLGLVVYQFLSSGPKRPEWLKDCPPVNGRTAGPWRGKGSFGHGFGGNRVRHK